MARFSIFSVTIFMILAAIALSLPTKRDGTQDLTLENAFAGLQVRLPYLTSTHSSSTDMPTECHAIAEGSG